MVKVQDSPRVGVLSVDDDVLQRAGFDLAKSRLDGTSFSHMTKKHVANDEELMQIQMDSSRRQQSQRQKAATDEARESADSPTSAARRRVCFSPPVQSAVQQRFFEPQLPKASTKGILKKELCAQEGWKDLCKQEEKVQEVLPRLCVGSKLVKYNTYGRPNARWFALSDDGTELFWSKAKGATKRGFKWAFKERSRSRQMADVQGVFYGPYNNQRVFQRFLDRLDSSAGKDWLCVTIAFDDRTLDFVCGGDREVTNWFTCLQGLAPLVGSYLRLGSLLWRRLIMKLNYYGLDPLNW
jgi:hypothetical protein